ncbi:MAG: hypothetical protein ABIZ81_16460 [Opitutaceae bacterium]
MRIDPTALLSAAVESQLLRPPLNHTFLEGNIDRRPNLERRHLRVQDGLGRLMKVTLGAGLKPLLDRADAFHAAVPDNSPATRFFLHSEEGDVWAQDWIEGPSCERPIHDLPTAVDTISALDRLETALEATAQASARAEWETELEEWSRSMIELPVWTPSEQLYLQRKLAPWLRDILRPTSPRHRWSNGDFFSGNLKLPSERVVLLDLEYGRRTHFYLEDPVRFLRLSPIAHRHPGLFAGLWPEMSPPWEIFFQLRQLALELAVNTPEYLTREVPLRKAYLRFSFEAGGLDAREWSEASRPPPPEFAKETVQLFWQTGDGPWSETDSRRIEVRRGEKQFVAFRIPTNAKRLRLDPTASIRPAVINAVGTIDAAGKFQNCSIQITAAGAELNQTPEGLHVLPHTTDAQLFIPFSSPATFLIAEIFVFEK